MLSTIDYSVMTSLGMKCQFSKLLFNILTLFDLGFFEPSVMGGGGHEGPHHNFVIIAPMVMKFGTGVKLDVFYTMVTKKL